MYLCSGHKPTHSHPYLMFVVLALGVSFYLFIMKSHRTLWGSSRVFNQFHASRSWTLNNLALLQIPKRNFEGDSM